MSVPSSCDPSRAIAMSPPLLDEARGWTAPHLFPGPPPSPDISVEERSPYPEAGVEPLPVRVVRSSRRTKSTAARIKGDHIEVRIPAWLSVEAEQKAVKSLVSRLEERRRIAARPIDLSQRARELARDYDLPTPEAVDWSQRQTSLWGSCTPARGTIRISARLAAAPEWVIDFVLLHELTHLVEANHGPKFKALLARYPLAERAEGFLAAMSAGLADACFMND